MKEPRRAFERSNHMRMVAWGFGCCCMTLSLTTGANAEETSNGGAWRLSGGVMYRSIRSVSFHAPTQSSTAYVPAAATRGIHGPQANVGDLNTFTDRVYDNGFVNQDAGTISDAATWYWGYKDASQVVDDTLRFQAQSGTETTLNRQTETTSFQAKDSNNDGAGVMVQAERLWHASDRLSFGLLLQASYVQLRSTFRNASFRDVQAWTTFSRMVEDVYDLQGVTPPDAPYSGTFAGPGPLIGNIPDARSLQQQRVASGTYEAYNQIASRLEIDLTTISLGAVMDGRLGRFRSALSAGPSLNIMAVDASHHETLRGGPAGSPSSPLAAWYDADDQTKVEPGVFAQIAIGFALTDQLSIDLFGRADWVSRLTGKVGPANYKANLDGHSAGFMLTWNFAPHQ